MKVNVFRVSFFHDKMTVTLCLKKKSQVYEEVSGVIGIIAYFTNVCTTYRSKKHVLKKKKTKNKKPSSSKRNHDSYLPHQKKQKTKKKN